VILICDKFLHGFKGAPLARRGLRAGRSGLDKGTLAATLTGLLRAGQRQPDRRTAYGPPPLVKSAARFAQRCPVARWFRREKAARRWPTCGRWPQWGNDEGPIRARGVGKSRALPGGSPTGAASRRLAAVPASLDRSWPAVTCQPAPAPRV